ncbi:MAG: hypothetical protein ACM31C_01295 [Acidobacteriota bacterium]
MVDIEHTSGPGADFAWPRILDFLLGIWLFFSAFLWPHHLHELRNICILGALIAIIGAWAMFAHAIHYVNTLTAIWLFFSTLDMHHASAATEWNDLLVAILVFVLSLVPNTWLVHLGRPRAGARVS